MVEKKAAERRQAEEKVEFIVWNRLLRGTITSLLIILYKKGSSLAIIPFY